MVPTVKRTETRAAFGYTVIFETPGAPPSARWIFAASFSQSRFATRTSSVASASPETATNCSSDVFLTSRTNHFLSCTV